MLIAGDSGVSFIGLLDFMRFTMPVIEMKCDAVDMCSEKGDHNSCFMFKNHKLCKHYKNKLDHLSHASATAKSWPLWKM